MARDVSEPLTILQSPTNGTVLSLGTNQVVLTVQDAAGNEARSTNAIVVVDTDSTPRFGANPQARPTALAQM